MPIGNKSARASAREVKSRIEELLYNYLMNENVDHCYMTACELNKHYPFTPEERASVGKGLKALYSRQRAISNGVKVVGREKLESGVYQYTVKLVKKN